MVSKQSFGTRQWVVFFDQNIFWNFFENRTTCHPIFIFPIADIIPSSIVIDFLRTSLHTSFVLCLWLVYPVSSPLCLCWTNPLNFALFYFFFSQCAWLCDCILESLICGNYIWSIKWINLFPAWILLRGNVWFSVLHACHYSIECCLLV